MSSTTSTRDFYYAYYEKRLCLPIKYPPSKLVAFCILKDFISSRCQFGDSCADIRDTMKLWNLANLCSCLLLILATILYGATTLVSGPAHSSIKLKIDFMTYRQRDDKKIISVNVLPDGGLYRPKLWIIQLFFTNHIHRYYLKCFADRCKKEGPLCFSSIDIHVSVRIWIG